MKRTHQMEFPHSVPFLPVPVGGGPPMFIPIGVPGPRGGFHGVPPPHFQHPPPPFSHQFQPPQHHGQFQHASEKSFRGRGGGDRGRGRGGYHQPQQHHQHHQPQDRGQGGHRSYRGGGGGGYQQGFNNRGRFQHQPNHHHQQHHQQQSRPQPGNPRNSHGNEYYGPTFTGASLYKHSFVEDPWRGLSGIDDQSWLMTTNAPTPSSSTAPNEAIPEPAEDPYQDYVNDVDDIRSVDGGDDEHEIAIDDSALLSADSTSASKTSVSEPEFSLLAGWRSERSDDLDSATSSSSALPVSAAAMGPKKSEEDADDSASDASLKHALAKLPRSSFSRRMGAVSASSLSSPSSSEDQGEDVSDQPSAPVRPRLTLPPPFK